MTLIFERVFQVVPASMLYWLGFLVLPNRFILAKHRLGSPSPTESEIGEALGLEIHEVICRFFDSQQRYEPGDGRTVIEVHSSTLTIRKLWIVKGWFTGTHHQVGTISWSVGFSKYG